MIVYKVEVEPMISNAVVNPIWGGEFTDYSKARTEFISLCDNLNLDNASNSYNGKETGDIGYDYRVTLSQKQA